MATRVVDEVLEIKQRADQLAKERAMVLDIDKAFGVWLDIHANRVDPPLKRSGDESDYSYRSRIKAKMVSQGLM